MGSDAITQAWKADQDQFELFSKVEFDALFREKKFLGVPLETGLSDFAKEFGPYNPERWAFGRLIDGRLVKTQIAP